MSYIHTTIESNNDAIQSFYLKFENLNIIYKLYFLFSEGFYLICALNTCLSR